MECLARSLFDNGIQPQLVIFTTCNERLNGTTRLGKTPMYAMRLHCRYWNQLDKTFKIPETPFPNFPVIYANLWKRLDPEAEVLIETTIEGALNLAKKIGEKSGGMQTLVTGSLHMVGGALNILRPYEWVLNLQHAHLSNIAIYCRIAMTAFDESVNGVEVDVLSYSCFEWMEVVPVSRFHQLLSEGLKAHFPIDSCPAWTWCAASRAETAL